ncbi:MAG: MarR family transcriptional regulator [Solirubrobacteraceae bacterium]
MSHDARSRAWQHSERSARRLLIAWKAGVCWQGGVRVTTLAERAGMSRQAITYLIRELEGKGYLERHPDPSDRRATLVHLTERGEAAVRELRDSVRRCAPVHGDVQVLNRLPGVPPFDALVPRGSSCGSRPTRSRPVCSLAHLRAMKRAAGRPRDLVDLAELDELHGTADRPGTRGGRHNPACYHRPPLPGEARSRMRILRAADVSR